MRTKTHDPSDVFVLCSFKSTSSCMMASWLLYWFLVTVAAYITLVNDVYFASCSQHLTNLLANNFLLFYIFLLHLVRWNLLLYIQIHKNTFQTLIQKSVGIASIALFHWHSSPLTHPSFLLGFRHPSVLTIIWWDSNRSLWEKSMKLRLYQWYCFWKMTGNVTLYVIPC